MSSIRSPSRGRDRRAGAARLTLLVLLIALLGACAPTVSTPSPGTPAADATQTVAEIAYHRMAIGRLQTGVYTTNILIDLELPRGVRWTVLEFGDDDYVLRFTNDSVPDVVWIVDPRGVRVRSAP